MRRLALLTLSLVLLCVPAPALAGQSPADRLSDLQDELDSLREDIEDLQEPVEEFELFDQCAYQIGVTQRPDYLYGPNAVRRPALAFDIRGFGRAQFTFLAFPAEEPPSIECNEDAGEEDSDD
jgi:hypothetical protein